MSRQLQLLTVLFEIIRLHNKVESITPISHDVDFPAAPHLSHSTNLLFTIFEIPFFHQTIVLAHIPFMQMISVSCFAKRFLLFNCFAVIKYR